MLNDKIALVTGACTGLGKAVIEKFVGAGAKVYAVASQSPEEKSVPGAIFLRCDVTSEADVRRVCEEIAAKEDHLDSLVTISEKLFRGGVTEVDEKEILDASKHICLAPMLFTKYTAALLKKSKNPSITHDVPMSAYMTEKDYLNSSLATAVINYTRQSSSQVRPIRVNAILYGILTDHLLLPEEIAKYSTPEQLAKIPAGRLGVSMDVANVNAFLASDKARYLNSGAWAVDGGYYTMNPRTMGNNGI